MKSLKKEDLESQAKQFLEEKKFWANLGRVWAGSSMHSALGIDFEPTQASQELTQEHVKTGTGLKPTHAQDESTPACMMALARAWADSGIGWVDSVSKNRDMIFLDNSHEPTQLSRLKRKSSWLNSFWLQ